MKPFFFLIILFSLASVDGLLAQSKPVRARLPSPESLKTDIFFQDAFAEGLRGARPAKLGMSSAVNASRVAAKPEAPAGFQWSTVVSARTLEDEVKSLQIQLQQTITTPGKFSGGGYLKARSMFTELATLFSVIHQYDGKVRWKPDAALARDLFTRAAANTKTTSIQAFNEAKNRKFDLEELVRGGRLVSEKKAKSDGDWSLINRAALMQRFTQSYDEGLAIWTRNTDKVAEYKSDIERESELLMMLSRVLTQNGMEDGGDEDYATYSRKLEESANDVLEAVRANDPEAARLAASAIGQACTACHEDYKG